ncbi:hypothetical protein EMIHUDRAFT_459727 [Emiliania huxleyi CCMP1516]|uniref:Uncharacterized protein n=2 Tax=Emiliania huxleyi TaxID=2903 RepID=A0A0D3IKH5_EMIH1|nr:hypothetical protein EMIHUDRAFT_460300 [Emiliania huxleyi CCMP1516]XP_005764189.1 hypothetical protein EMIHUDRAFT_459727 [Emiliania huxleyi CCMP1516]EOD03656.1 hypothetical protein EMIHUDRAFT_460300 [Emiliania huxleyi CCMP1516]EOD11760.1 hypothetical protein EMIHUDRAFT_459727 [Emiliania huxleyi CCMP1516]|eukprot:XP_005756085.1 hypothetical protein EMIHUDRAFT_460300 [Emiliania huxleyi CCMP1516]
MQRHKSSCARNGSQPPPATGRVCRTCRSAAVANAVRPCIIHTVSHAFTPATGTQPCIGLAARQRWQTPLAHVSLTWCPRAQSCRTRHPQRRLAPLTMYQSHGEIASCSQFGRSLRQRGRAGWRGWGAGDRALRGVGRLQAARRLCMLGPEGACPTTYGSQGVAGGANRAV